MVLIVAAVIRMAGMRTVPVLVGRTILIGLMSGGVVAAPVVVLISGGAMVNARTALVLAFLIS